MEKIVFKIVNGWCNDNAPWLDVFLSLCAGFILFFMISFSICGTYLMLFVPNN